MKVRYVCSRLLQLHLYVCVSVFPDISKVTTEDLLHFRTLTSMMFLTLRGAPSDFTKGQDDRKDQWGWVRVLPNALKRLDITGELQRHFHAAGDISTAWTELIVTRWHRTQLDYLTAGPLFRYQRAKCHLSPCS